MYSWGGDGGQNKTSQTTKPNRKAWKKWEGETISVSAPRGGGTHPGSLEMVHMVNGGVSTAKGNKTSSNRVAKKKTLLTVQSAKIPKGQRGKRQAKKA